MTLDLSFAPKSHVYTLVGLNESGKTTILEAVNWSSPNLDRSLEPLELPGYNIKDANTLIPISKRANFNGDVSTAVRVLPNASDEVAIKQFALRELKFRLTENVGMFTVTRKKEFKDSRFIADQSEHYWAINLKGKRIGSRNVISAFQRQRRLEQSSRLYSQLNAKYSLFFKFPV
jgi:hypothetical protein